MSTTGIFRISRCIGAALTATVAVVVLAGCASTRVVSRHEPLKPIGRATVFLRSGDTITAAGLTSHGDTLILRDHLTRREMRLPFADIERATTRAWAAGFLSGLVKGAAVGGGIGVVLGVASGMSQSGDGGAYSDPYSSAIILGGMGFFFGAPIGGLVGMARGRRIYRFAHTPPPVSSRVARAAYPLPGRRRR